MTTREGDPYIIRQLAGGRTAIEKVTEPNGNTLTFSASGILHSTGKSVTFTRDTVGRITRVTDPMGAFIQYVYDAAGDLVEVRDPELRVTRYTYDADHRLIDIIDGRGVRVSRNVYDEAGRLIETIDSNGNRITVQHDLGARTEVITDREGAATVMTYDTRGRVVREIAPNGMETRREYGARRTMTRETVAWGTPLEHEANFEYNATDDLTRRYETNLIPQAVGTPVSQFIEERWTYDARGNQTQRIDPRGFVTDSTYDTKNNLLVTIQQGDPNTTDDDIITDSVNDGKRRTGPSRSTRGACKPTLLHDMMVKLLSMIWSATSTSKWTYNRSIITLSKTMIMLSVSACQVLKELQLP